MILRTQTVLSQKTKEAALKARPLFLLPNQKTLF